MEQRSVGESLVRIRRVRMWTQGKLARKAGVSPTTISGIESGKIARPHFGTIRKLAEVLEVSPERLLVVASGEHASGGPVPGSASRALSFEWALAAREEEFERELEAAGLEELNLLKKELDGELARLRVLYGESGGDGDRRRHLKRRIRAVAAQLGSLDTSIAFHPESGPGY